MPKFGRYVERVHDGNRKNIREWSHPPPLNSLNGKFCDDESFMNVSLNLIARYEALNLSAAESIKSMLVCPDDQVAYYEALCIKVSQARSVGGYSSSSCMIQRLDREFGDELRNLCSHHILEGKCTDSVQAPMTPRNGWGQEGHNFFLNTCKNGQARRFFPDIEPKLGRPPKRKVVRNIDWHLATAVQQVVSLSLDGAPAEKREITCYNPPSPMPFRAA